jgi:hypothetical protein
MSSRVTRVATMRAVHWLLVSKSMETSPLWPPPQVAAIWQHANTCCLGHALHSWHWLTHFLRTHTPRTNAHRKLTHIPNTLQTSCASNCVKQLHQHVDKQIYIYIYIYIHIYIYMRERANAKCCMFMCHTQLRANKCATRVCSSSFVSRNSELSPTSSFTCAPRKHDPKSQSCLARLRGNRELCTCTAQGRCRMHAI